MKRLSYLSLLCALASLLPATGASAVPSCAGDHAGGEWRSYGATNRGTRSQDAEQAIGPATVGSLVPAWSSDVSSLSGQFGRFENTPVVADGCLYIGLTNGIVAAMNADTAEVVWKTQLPYVPGAGYGGAIVGSVAVANGHVYATVSDASDPYLAILDQATGDLLFRTVVDERPQAFVTASPVVWGELVLVGIAGQEAAAGSRGGFAVVDGLTGAILAKQYVIGDEEFAAGYEGASIWTTPVIDEAGGYAYAGTGNPSSSLESPNANAVVKIDLDQSRPTFGTIVDAYKGNWDSFTPNCNSATATFGCQHIDVDFGASLNLLSDAFGRTLVGALQKSGVYYAVYADTMQEAWTATVGGPGHVFNAASPAVDASGVYIPATPPGQVVALDRAFGSLRWAAPMADGVHYQPTSVANGVVYTATTTGLLLAYSAADGRPLVVRPMAQDTGAFDPTAPAGSGDIGGALGVASTSAGMAIARNTLYVNFQTFVIAYRLPGDVR